MQSVLYDATMDMATFTPHSTRSASTSKVETKVTKETRLKTGVWCGCDHLQITTSNKLMIPKFLPIAL